MINKVWEYLESTLSHNDKIMEEERVGMDATMEEERVCMAQNTIIIQSDEKYDSVRRKIISKPVRSYNKASKFLAKHKSDNEETPFGNTHEGPLTSKQETLERIKRLHIKCDFLDTEHLFMIPKT